MKFRRRSLTTLIVGLICALAVLTTSVLAQQQRQQAKPATRASATNTKARASHQTAAKKIGTSKSGASSAQALTVQEVDAEGFRKLLASASSSSGGGGDTRRPVLVNFWATWCVPCRDEFPDLVKIDTDYRARGLNFITISLDDASEIKTTVPQFLKEVKAAHIPTYLLNTPEPEAVITAVDPTWGGGMPMTFLFDGQGKIVFKHMGRVKPAELRLAIEKVISNK